MPSEHPSHPAWAGERDAARDLARKLVVAGEPSFDDLWKSFHYDPDRAEITLNGQRMVLTDNNALGIMRRELVSSLGYDKARGLVTRIGYGIGSADAQLALDLRKEDDIFAGFAVGPQLHALKGSVKVEPLVFEADRKTGHFYSEYHWHNSAECLSHRQELGITPYPGGWQQVGYASGYASAFFGRAMIFREVQCVAMGHDRCFLVGKAAEQWENADEEMRWFRTENYAQRQGGVAAGKLLPDEDLRIGQRSIVGASSAFNLALHLVNKVARTDAPVLFTGESGVGKEVFARELHKRSNRADGPLVSVNCAAIPETLIEAELFGVDKGAFTGATASRPGRFERAEGGTLFLDEIGTLSFAAQAKLLRVLQEGEYDRVGGSRPLRTNARLVAATNADLHRDVANGTFRSDLLHRISTFPITIQPLRRRRADIPLLANYFLRKMCAKHGRTQVAFDDAIIRHFLEYDWPGNIREMENLIERAVILADDNELIGIHHVTMTAQSFDGGHTDGGDGDGRAGEPFSAYVMDRIRRGASGLPEASDRIDALLLDARLTRDEVVDRLIGATLVATSNNVTETARRLGMTRSQVNYWLRGQRGASSQLA
ncbi:sigma-54-dependent Fis family transcriptional regulator [Novosphingobium capsulatum]|uniref:sigma-54-dependent Fis family transcriptional regulator n=1 Tax=Novosphingobium capsulatum TaxID=13688 RepID=UPI0007899F61|nr:sigma-54-dependent Fis family transcriptional regulator [Novosphingobium capsulatum]WQD95081.1 sigma 54-interacting transcriptional regulator [Novosphingobium capsulatum]